LKFKGFLRIGKKKKQGEKLINKKKHIIIMKNSVRVPLRVRMTKVPERIPAGIMNQLNGRNSITLRPRGLGIQRTFERQGNFILMRVAQRGIALFSEKGELISKYY